MATQNESAQKLIERQIVRHPRVLEIESKSQLVERQYNCHRGSPWYDYVPVQPKSQYRTRVKGTSPKCIFQPPPQQPRPPPHKP
eukprot:3190013-Amphidinium_carterae.1